MTRHAKAALAAAVVLVTLGCGATASADQPKPAGWQRVNTDGADTQTWCHPGIRVWLARTAQGGLAMTSQPDPTCTEAAK